MFDVKINKYFRMGFIILFVCFGLFYQNKALSVVAEDKTLVIDVLPLVKQKVDLVSEYVGYITPIKSVEVMANVSGYIDEIWAVGGEKVRLGDNLVLIDQKQYKAEVDALKASNAMAKAKYTNAKNYYNRIKKAGNNAVSPSQIDDAKAQFLSADAEVKQTSAELQKAMVMLDYTVLQASIDGVLGDVNLTKGNFISAGQTKLFDIIQQNPIRVRFAISNKDYLNSFASRNSFDNLRIKLRLANNKIYQFEGKFAYFDNQIQKQTSSVSVFADFENPNGELLANSYVDVMLEKQLSDVFVIKQNFATLENDGIFVNIVNNNKLRKEKLNVLGYYNDAYVADNKFAKNDFLVIDNIVNINKNTQIKIRFADKKAEKI